LSQSTRGLRASPFAPLLRVNSATSVRPITAVLSSAVTVCFRVSLRVLRRDAWRDGMSKEPSVAQKLMGDFAPKLLQLTDDVLFGDVWERPQLSKRDRSLITVSALIALNRPDQLRRHLQRARDNGLTKDEIVETITHLAFYAGWPNAMTAVLIAKELFE
jgi:4-carboxymuconolactone decarboxylase